MIVKDLIEVLSKLPPDAPIGLRVYGHHYDSQLHRATHGPMVIFTDEYGHIILASDTGEQIRNFYGPEAVFVDRSEDHRTYQPITLLRDVRS